MCAIGTGAGGDPITTTALGVITAMDQAITAMEQAVTATDQAPRATLKAVARPEASTSATAGPVILKHNHARRGSRKRPDPPRLRKAGRGLPRRTRGDGGRHD